MVLGQPLQQVARPVAEVGAELEALRGAKVVRGEAVPLAPPPVERGDERGVVRLGASGEAALGRVGLGLLAEGTDEGRLVAERGADLVVSPRSSTQMSLAIKCNYDL